MKHALHFVGFRGEEYQNACHVFGPPDFIHNTWDERAVAEVFDGDIVIFGPKGEEGRVRPYTYDDSAFF